MFTKKEKINIHCEDCNCVVGILIKGSKLKKQSIIICEECALTRKTTLNLFKNNYNNKYQKKKPVDESFESMFGGIFGDIFKK